MSHCEELFSSTTRSGPAFLPIWEDLTLSRVELRGIVVGCVPVGSTGVQLNIDDGTGRIPALIWSHENEQDFASINGYHNTFVSVKGQLNVFRGLIQVKVDQIECIAREEEPTEEMLWWMDVKEEWERLAASTRASHSSELCPCLCHSGIGVACKCLGDASVWSPIFNRAVAVISTALRLTRISSLTISNIVDLVKTSTTVSSSLQAWSCLCDCATVQAVSELITQGFAVRFPNARISIRNERLPVQLTEPEPLPRYPLSQLTDMMESQLDSPKQFSKPKFMSASQAYSSNQQTASYLYCVVLLELT
jgi:hypothetical protein